MNGVITSTAAHLVIGAAAIVCLSGCGGTYDAHVTGTVTLNSAPLSLGTIKFTPQQSGPSGYGLIQSDGSYEVMTGRESGLPSGDYVVTVVANEPSRANANPSMPPSPGKAITPPWYREPEHSPLKYTVTPGRNVFDIELTMTPPAGWNPRASRSL